MRLLPSSWPAGRSLLSHNLAGVGFHRGSSITPAGVPQRLSWEKRLQQRAERASVQAAQKAVTDTIIEEKRVRLGAAVGYSIRFEG